MVAQHSLRFATLEKKREVLQNSGNDYDKKGDQFLFTMGVRKTGFSS